MHQRFTFPRQAAVLACLLLAAFTATTRAGEPRDAERPEPLPQGEKDAVLLRVLDLDSEKASVSAKAETRLIKAGSRIVPYLCELLTSGREDIPKAEVVKVLGEIGDPRAAATVTPMTAPGKPLNLRRMAVMALPRMGEGEEEEVARHLMKLLRDEQRMVAHAAFQGLTNLVHDERSGAAAAEEIVDIIDDELPDAEGQARTWMIALLGETRSERAVEPLLDLVRYEAGDESGKLKLLAAKALGQIGDGEAADELVKLLRDDDARVRKGAAGALTRLSLDEGQREELALALVDELGVADETGGDVNDLVRKVLGSVAGGGEGAVALPIELDLPPLPGTALAAPMSTPAERSRSYFYMAVGGGAVAFTLILFYLRSVLIRRKAAAIEAGRRKLRRRSF